LRRPEIAVALDLATPEDALALVAAIGDDASWYKVGSMLALSDGSALVRELVKRGKSVFLDLKWHDIPNTVAGAVASAAAVGASLATVHLAGGRRMLEAAAEGRGSSRLRLVGVGVLTSLDAAAFSRVVGRDVREVAEEQERLMELGLGVLDGFVAAPSETARVRRVAGESAFLVTPGIRPAGDSAGDHSRSATPAEAARAGSDLLVVGRPITEARDPGAVVRAIRAEIAAAD
jgi:orotidine-5'-phosphate decarboxylase